MAWWPLHKRSEQSGAIANAKATSRERGSARNLSKSKLMALRQCPKRLWLEIHRADLKDDSAATQASFRIGHQVGDIARKLYDPDGKGAILDPQRDGFAVALKRSSQLLQSDAPIFEASFASSGGLVLADVMLPEGGGKHRTWRMVEVKSATSVKDYHREDAAVQAYVAKSAGVPLSAIAVAHIDSTWVYQGDGDYRGLLVEEDLTEEAFGRAREVAGWIADGQRVAAQRQAPAIRTGKQCNDPFACGFLGHCEAEEPKAEYPVEWLPRLQSKSVKELIETKAITDLRDVPDELLNDLQRRVKAHTLAGKPYFDGAAAARELSQHDLPGVFLDFETVQFAVPIWKGTRPYQQIPFQFSAHAMSLGGGIEHTAFLDLSGTDPSLPFAEALIAACGDAGPVFVYNASFERTRLKELAERLSHIERPLMAISERIVDLLPITRKHYYHPAQEGSWSIKSVLPAIAPELSYQDLEGVQDGSMAMEAFLEAIRPDTPGTRREAIRAQLLEYCKLDTYAMIGIWRHLAGRTDIRL